MELVRDYFQTNPMVALGQFVFLSIAILAILYGMGGLETIARWANARWPKPKNDKIILPSAWNFNVNRHSVDISEGSDHGHKILHHTGRGLSVEEWERLENRYK